MKESQYKTIEEQMTPTPPYAMNVLKAFLIGGFICVIGQAISFFYMIFFDFTEKTVGNPTVATMIFISMLLTGLGLYRKLGQFAGAGSAVPVTGFGNAVVSAAIEHRTEGYVLGVGSNMFKLAGSVIVFGTVSAFVVALVKTVLVMLGVVTW
ncbi:MULTISPECIES: stage V sporulation protein AC [Bacillales]|uniref:Stage V sporulation protein AC n=1 Tax=Lysinibacillus louembei TaxID=1470088 RepID=A0ABZ0RVR5_9BACI|nr:MULTISPECIES: stage V sporulation protein AC [Bacillales]MCT6925883.1 stage V sporulation protein AC [Metasolibacillus sp.]MCT6942083.1 stage V sporulation protein AC [Metasolibacillus sp.]WPK12324.1 stage V sporulation protein AC [Lysinibacillus louembei]